MQDVGLTGINRNEVGSLLFPRLDACRDARRPAGRRAGAASCSATRAVRAFLQRLVDTLHAARHRQRDARRARALVLAEPPSIDRGEITDKGSINQRAVLTHRDADVEAHVPRPRLAT